MEDKAARSSSGERRRGNRARRLKVILIVAVVGLAIWSLQRFAAPYVQRFASWVEDLGPEGPLVFVVGYALLTVALVPGSFLTLAAGATFGLARGVVYVFTAACIGAALAFLVSRYVARRAVERRVQREKRFEAIDRAIGREGLKITVLLRLSPVFPFNFLNYALGLTKVRFLDYNIASLAMIPGTFLYVYYGKVAGEAILSGAGLSQEKDVWYYVSLGVGLVATIVVTAIVTRIARRALKAATAGEEEASARVKESVPGVTES